MVSSDREEIMILGNWLERFLQLPEMHIHEYRKLAREAIQILNLDYKLHKKEVSIIILERLISIDTWHDIHRQWNSNYDEFFWDSYNDEFFLMIESQAYSEYLSKELHNSVEIYDKREDFSGDLLPYLSIATGELYNLLRIQSEVLPNLLKSILNEGASWPEIFKPNESLDHDVYELLERYQYFCNKIVVRNGKIQKINIFMNLKEASNPRNILDWNAMVSHIFFRFLMLGGHNYYIFCKKCGAFSIVQRRGRKKYCSDGCRSSQKR